MGPVLALALAMCAQASEAEVPDSPPQPELQQQLIPPRALTPTSIEFPEGAPPMSEPAVVKVKIKVDENGDVVGVRLVQGAGSPFDEAVMDGVTHFAFAPATYGGQAVPVEIAFTQRFEPPPEPVTTTSSTSSAAVALDAVFAGRLKEKGTRKPVGFARIDVRVGDVRLHTSTDDTGWFEMSVPAGKLLITVTGFGYRPFRQTEVIVKNERLVVGYRVQRLSYNPYEVTVIGKAVREEVSRTVLRGREIAQIPGTFGDPFRVVNTLPGVTQMVSLLPFPIVRGSSPGNTGFLLDGVRVPLLFHLLAGPSVIHPDFVDSIEFYPGVFSVEHGGYTGGIIDGRTRRARPGEKKIDVTLDFLQSGAFVRYPIVETDTFGEISITGAGRVGYPGVLLSLVNPDFSLNYWDYQVRVDGGKGKHGWSVFLFGAADEIKSRPDDDDTAPLETQLRLQFHRLDLRYDYEDDFYSVALGYDESFTNGIILKSFNVTPQMEWNRQLQDNLRVRMGFEAFARRNEVVVRREDEDDRSLAEQLSDNTGSDPFDDLIAGALLTEALWRPTPDLLIRPGFRVDLYDDTNVVQLAFDPRLLARYRVAEDTYVKGGVGIYHQPPRFVIPLPGLDQLAFELGLLNSIQTTVGTEVPLPYGFSIDFNTYFNFMDPIVFDLAVNEDIFGTGEDGGDPPEEEELIEKVRGRAYGAEILLRRRSTNGAFGWISYTFNRSERRRNGAWVPFDFDRTHILSVVAGLPLPRNWTLGMRMSAQSGRPVTTTDGFNAGRTSGYFRFDLRVDKRAVWNDWLLDFYVDIANVVLSPEEVSAGNNLRYVLPTIGFRAVL